MSGRAVKPWQIQSKTTHIDDDDMDDKCDNDTVNMHDFNLRMWPGRK